MKSLGKSCLFALYLGSVAMAGMMPAIAQQKHPIPTAKSEGGYIEERAIDVGDVPGHQVRIYQLRYKYPKKDLVFLGIPVTESVTTGISDYTSWSGPFTNYSVYAMEDGSKIFVRGAGTTESHPDGGRKYSFVENLVGGTGKFRGIRGQLRGSGERSAGAKSVAESQSGEYWIEE